MAWKCVCGFSAEKHPELRAHHRGCEAWKDQLGRCSDCQRRHYRHTKDCPSVGDDKRRRLIRKHGIDPKEFEVFLKLLAHRYRRLSRIHMI